MGRKKKKNLSWSGEKKKLNPHIEVKKKKKTPEFLQNAHIQKIRKRFTFEKFALSSGKNPWYGLGWSQSNA